MRWAVLCLALIACGRTDLDHGSVAGLGEPPACHGGALLAYDHDGEVHVDRVCPEGGRNEVARLAGTSLAWSPQGRWLMRRTWELRTLGFWSPGGTERAINVAHPPREWHWLAHDDAVLVQWDKGYQPPDSTIIDLRGPSLVTHDLDGIPVPCAVAPDGRHVAHVGSSGKIQVAMLDPSVPGMPMVDDVQTSLSGDCDVSPDGHWFSVLSPSSVGLVATRDGVEDSVVGAPQCSIASGLWAEAHPILATGGSGVSPDCEGCDCSKPGDLHLLDLRGANATTLPPVQLLIEGTDSVRAFPEDWATSPMGCPRLAALAPSVQGTPAIRILDIGEEIVEVGTIDHGPGGHLQRVDLAGDGQSVVYQRYTADQTDLFAATAPHWTPVLVAANVHDGLKARCAWSPDARHAACPISFPPATPKLELRSVTFFDGEVVVVVVEPAEGYRWIESVGFSRDGSMLAYLRGPFVPSDPYSELMIVPYAPQGPRDEPRALVATSRFSLYRLAWQP